MPKNGRFLDEEQEKSLLLKLRQAKIYKQTNEHLLIELDTCMGDMQRFVSEANRKLSGVQNKLNEIPLLNQKISDLSALNDTLLARDNKRQEVLYKLIKPQNKWKELGDKLIFGFSIILATSTGFFVSKI